MPLLDTTREVIRMVEEKSGFPVDVGVDPRLSTIAVVKMARGPIQMHRIVYNPNYSAQVDYTICFQCGFILRLFEHEPDKRVDFAGNGIGRSEVEKLLMDPGSGAQKMRMQKPQIMQLRDQLFDGIMMQLRSVPIGMRIDLWLLNQYSELREQQRASLLKQFRANVEILKPEYERTFPAKIYQPNLTMNIAYARFWADLNGEPNLARAYRNHSYTPNALALLKIYNEMPGDPTNDRNLIDAWANELGLQGWYNWVKYETPNTR